jgi:hypothetical protein
MVFHHSSFLSGGDVIAAGTIHLHDGDIQRISNSSGHYQPSLSSLDQIITIFENHKVKIYNVEISE